MKGSLDTSGATASLRQVGLLLRQRLRLIVLTCALFFALGFTYCILATPSYEADGLVQVQVTPDSKTNEAVLGNLSDLLLNGSLLQTEGEMQILQSHLVLDKVIDSLGMRVQARPRVLPVIGGAIYRSNSSEPGLQPPLFGMRSFCWGGESIAVQRFDIPSRYWGKKFLVRFHAPDSYTLLYRGNELLSGKIGHLEVGSTPRGPLSIAVDSIVAGDGAEFVVRQYSNDDVVNQVRRDFDIKQQGRDSGVISVKYKSDDPGLAADFINRAEASYVDQNNTLRAAQAMSSLNFLRNQIPDLKKQLDEAQNKLKLYQVQHGTLDATQETQLTLKNLVDLDTQRLQLKEQFDEMSQQYDSAYPPLKAVMQKLKSVQDDIDRYQERVRTLPEDQQQMLGLLRDVDVSNQLYTNLLNSIQELSIVRAGTVGNVRVIDQASTPLKPSAPKLYLVVALSTMLGAILAIAYVLAKGDFLIDAGDFGVLESLLKIPLLAVVPFSQTRKWPLGGLRRGSASGHQLLAKQDGADATAEAVRSLRSALILQSAAKDASRVIAVCGPHLNVGKSFISANLAEALASAGKKVLLVDADLRRGHLERYFNIPHGAGLSDYLDGRADLNALIAGTEIPNLDVIFSGSSEANVADLLAQDRLPSAIEQLKARYDYVLIDTPPVLLVSDAGLIAKWADFTLLVTRTSGTSVAEIQEANRALKLHGKGVGGIVLNQLENRPLYSATGQHSRSARYQYSRARKKA